MSTRPALAGRQMSLLLIAWMVALPPIAEAQAPAPQPPPPPVNPGPLSPTSVTPDLLLDRLRQMEEKLDALSNQNAQLSQDNRRLAEQYNDLARQVRGTAVGSDASRTGPGPGEGMSGGTGGADGSGGGDKSSVAGGGSKTSGGDPTSSGRAQEVGNRRLKPLDLKALYDYENDGFRFATRDDELELRVRAMTQIDARIFSRSNQNPVSGGIYNPRTRIYFEGHLTKPIQYEFSFQNTFDTVALLDAYLNFNYDDRFNFRFGRYKAPFTYEWYRVHVWDLLAPERSLFATNFEANRRFGAMATGSVFDQRLEYAVGSFNGQRNSFQPISNSQDVLAFLNFKPFDPDEDSPLRNFQVGGSVDAGFENNPLTPAVITTSSPPSSASLTSGSAGTAANVPILAFNPTVRERGERALWELHSAYYYKGLSLLGAWDSGYQNYAMGSSGPAPVKVATAGYFIQAGYIVTGETIRDRTLIDPLHPFDLRKGRFGLGALELTARYSELQLGKSIFTGGLADPNLWSREAQMVDVGFNWYLNKFVKMYFDWEHTIFGTPVEYRPGARAKTNDLYWIRFQFYF
jgi:phosphate-selective porin OprO and OprP